MKEAVIFEVAGEGGSVKLVGRRRLGAEGWEYRRSINEMTMAQYGLEEDSAPANPAPWPEPKWVLSWAEALALMDRNPWAELTPRQVRAEFSTMVLEAASERLTTSPRRLRQLERWKVACDNGLGVPSDHRLAPLIARALGHVEFSDRWSDSSDRSFRPLAVWALELRHAVELGESALTALIETLCFRKRSQVLEDLVGARRASRLLAWLPRVEWTQFTLEDWGALSAIADADPTHSLLGHVERITPILIHQHRRIPEEFRLPAVFEVASRLSVSAERWDRLRHFLAQASADGRAALVRAAGEIDSIGAFWDLYFRAEGRFQQPFDIPDVFMCGALLEPLATPSAMQAEAVRMGNCLANRASTVRNGSRVYFRPRDGALINADLVRRGSTWLVGSILGARNEPVDEAVGARIRAELEWMAQQVPAANDVAMGNLIAYIDEARQSARQNFSAGDIGQIVESLMRIHGRSRSWQDGAYAIVETKTGQFVQFMSSPDGTELLFEISSHKYNLSVQKRLTADVVDMIERSGFVWPDGKVNFLRWFNVASSEDLHVVAELALAVLARVFGHTPEKRLEITVHLPKESS